MGNETFYGDGPNIRQNMALRSQSIGRLTRLHDLVFLHFERVHKRPCLSTFSNTENRVEKNPALRDIFNQLRGV